MSLRLSRRGLLGAGPALLVSRPTWAASHPGNVLLITVDQQSLRTVSALGLASGRTPNLDALGARGVNFANSWCVDPACCPARAAWVLGRPGSETGVVLNRCPVIGQPPSMGEVLAAGGIDPVFLGKWHVPGMEPPPGFRVCSPCSPNADTNDLMQVRAARAALAGLPTTRPFLLWVSLLGPHDICRQAEMLGLAKPDEDLGVPPGEDPGPPINLNDRSGEPATLITGKRTPWLGLWSPERFAALRWWNDRMVGNIDRLLGLLLDALANSAHAHNTTVIFTSDHGDNLGEHGLTFKESPYEAAVGVPFVIWSPHRMNPVGVDRQRLVSGLDLLPTLCDLFSVAPPAGLPGRSIMAQLRGADPGHPFIVSETLIEGRMVRDARHKLVRFRGDPQGMLFDLSTDPYERKNRFGDSAMASVQADLERALADWTARQRPTPISQRTYAEAKRDLRLDAAGD